MTGSPEAPLLLLDRASLRTGLILAAYGVLCCAVLGVVHHAAEPQLRRAEQALLQQQLQALIPAAGDPKAGVSIELIDGLEMRHAFDPLIEVLYHVREADKTTALIAQSTTKAGYAGPITLLTSLAVNLGGGDQLVGVRVVRHRETPGLGDAIDTRHSDWIFQFDALPADVSAPPWSQPTRSEAFDHITGATITSVAVESAVRDTLINLQADRDRISDLPGIEQFTINANPAP